MKALYPGSFDPPHLGHLDVIRRAAAVCDQLIVGIAVNPEKSPFLSIEERLAILRDGCTGLANVTVTHYEMATVHFARANGVKALVRGLRAASDLEAEAPMAAVHRGLGFETLFLLCDPALAHVSSRVIRQVMGAGLDPHGLLPDGAIAAIRRHRGG